MVVSQIAAPGAVREVSGFASIIAVIMLFAAGKAVLFDTMDPDLFWHLRVAEQLHHDGIGPIVDQLSYSTVKTPWSPYSWLGELGMKWIWDHTGLRGAVIVQATLQAAFILLIATCAAQSLMSGDEPAPFMPIVFTTTLGAFLSLPYLSFRPVLPAIDLLAVCTLLLLRDRRLGERTRAVWITPFLAAITINLHIFAIFVPLWVGALTAVAAFEGNKPRLKRYMLLLVFCMLGCCCTPMLRGTLTTIHEYATVNPLMAHRMIAELEPMYRGTMHQITLGIVALILACALFCGRHRAGEWVWLAGMFALWVKCGRAAPIFVPIFAPVVSCAFPQLSDRVLGAKWVTHAATSILLLGLLRICIALPDNSNVDAWLNRRGPDLPGYPASAAEFVDARIHRARGRLINEFDWGGYLAWKLPEYQVFLDGRTQLYPPSFWHAAYLDDQRDTTQLLASTDADAAILPAGKSRFHDSLVQLGWKRVFSDARAEVMIPPASLARTAD